jgi:hypothetical protein
MGESYIAAWFYGLIAAFALAVICLFYIIAKDMRRRRRP